MAITYTTTTRWLLKKIKGTNKVSDVDDGIGALADQIDQTFIGLVEDTAAKRPAAGTPNRLFKATDTGLMSRDTGTGWEAIVGPGLGSPGVLTSRSFGAATTPSATRPTMVVLSLTTSGTKAEDQEREISVLVNGVQIALLFSRTRAIGEGHTASVSFICPVGVAWEATVSGSASGQTVKSSYQTL